MMLLSVAASANSGSITTATLVLIAIGVVCALAVIAWGTMRRRAKASEVAEAEEHAALAGHAPTPAPEPEALPEDVPEEALGSPDEAAPAAAPQPVPTPMAADTPPAATASQPLTTLKGLGPKAATRLGELGITSVDQLAALSPDRIAAIDAEMGSFAGRITRDRWVEQAKLLAAGDIAGFEAAFGKLGG